MVFRANVSAVASRLRSSFVDVYIYMNSSEKQRAVEQLNRYFDEKISDLRRKSELSAEIMVRRIQLMATQLPPLEQDLPANMAQTSRGARLKQTE